MSRNKNQIKDQYAEILLERKEKKPQTQEIVKATVLNTNSQGVLVDINKAYEGFIPKQELGEQNITSFTAGQQMEVFVVSEDKNQSGSYRLSIKEIESEAKWKELDSLSGQNLEVTITKILKSGVEARIERTNQIGFIPYGYVDNKYESLDGVKRDNWSGIKILARLHEHDKSKNKIILNNKVICDELKDAKAKEVLNSIAIGQIITGEVVRLADFGIFVDIGGIDALVPSSELSWERFRVPSEIIKVGDKVTAKIFKIEAEQQRLAMSVKQATIDPWSAIAQDMRIGYQQKAPIVSHAEFGVFVKLMPGVEALLHKSNYNGKPESELTIGAEINVEIINIEVEKKRIGVKPIENLANEESQAPQQQSPEQKSEEAKVETATQEPPQEPNSGDNKELEHV